jgi:glycoprotein-N-acetylgalactosamine 3-beta-galactosyltransferase
MALLVLVLFPLLPLFEISNLEHLLCASIDKRYVEFTLILGDKDQIGERLRNCLKREPITIPHLSFPEEIGRNIASHDDARIAILLQDASQNNGLDILAELMTSSDLVIVGENLENPNFRFLQYLQDIVPNGAPWLTFSFRGLSHVFTELGIPSLPTSNEMGMYLEYALPYSGIGMKGDSFLAFKAQLMKIRHFPQMISTCSAPSTSPPPPQQQLLSQTCLWRRQRESNYLLQESDNNFLVRIVTSLSQFIPFYEPHHSMSCSAAVFGEDGFKVIESLRKKSNPAIEREHQMFLDSPRLLCLVYTTHANRTEPLQAVIGTWAKRCDGFIAFSDVTDESLGAISMTDASQMLKRGKWFSHEPAGESFSESWVESYHKMWNKAQVMWSLVATSELIDRYDYFFIGGDDVYLIPDNLRRLLLSSRVKTAEGLNRTKPIYLGRQLRANAFTLFNSGGSGYVLNRAAVATLYDLLSLQSSPCLTEKFSSMEDLLVGRCLYEAGIKPLPSTSDVDGRETFHPLSPGVMAAMDPPEWFKRMAVSSRGGLECCSRESVSFHYLSPSQMRCLHQLLHE